MLLQDFHQRLGTEQTQLAITCSKLTIETLEQGVKICSKLTIKTPKRRHFPVFRPNAGRWCLFGAFIVNFEHISHLVLVFLLLALVR